MTDILHKIRYDAPIDKVFDAISTAEGISKWYSKWTTFKEGKGEVGTMIRIGYSDGKYESLCKVTQFEKNKKIEWTGMDKPGEMSNAGSKITFELNEETVEFYDNKKMTALVFINSGLEDKDKYYPEMNSRWAFFLLSLKDYLEKGKGSPIPDDIYM